MKEKQIGKVTHYYDKIKVGVIELSNTLKVGDKIHVKGAHDDFEQSVTSMQLDHTEIKSAKKGQEIALEVDQVVHKNDNILK